ncbi:MAG: ATP-grasp domain-containing protein [Clostridia bacterium]|nr:ATP-grasp domain-containing protein [Clostridia bacterium]
MYNGITPVLLGADLNCYGMARAFSEAYGAISHAFGKYKLGAIKYSKIVKFHKIPPLYQKDAVLRLLTDFACQCDQKPYLFGCTDEYALFVAENKDVLSDHFVCPCPDAETARAFSDKAVFYEKCADLSLPYPKTVAVSALDEAYVLGELPFGYPVIIKPSCSCEYWRHPFENMRKVYKATSRADGERILSLIFSSGYGGKVLIQENVDPADQYVATCFSAKGNVRGICVGRVLLGEVTPKGLGNHVAIITEKNDNICDAVSLFLKSTGYDGFSNFDILRDEKTGKYYLLEINLRQGRSNYYMTAAGMNAARLALGDHGGDAVCGEEIFWHSVPTKIVLDRCGDADRRKITSLVKKKKAFSSFGYKRDLKNPLRIAYLAVHNAGFFAKYRDAEN